MSPSLDFVALDRRHDLAGPAVALNDASWPAFLRHDPMSVRYGRAIYERFAEFQMAAVDPATGALTAVANGVPIRWEGDSSELPDHGWDWAIERSFEDVRHGREPTVLCALSVSVGAADPGAEIVAAALAALRQAGVSRGLGTLIAPVRPSRKSEEPSVPMEEYVARSDSDGAHPDPRIRMHQRSGGSIVKICPRSMLVVGSVAEWARWTESSFAESGEYAVAGGLVPVRIDLEADRGSYVEPNVWMVHPAP